MRKLNDEQLLMCDCNSHAITAFWDHELKMLDLSFWQMSQHENSWGWRSRWKLIWRLLKGRTPYGDMITINRQKVLELANYLAACLQFEDDPQAVATYQSLALLRDSGLRFSAPKRFTDVWGISQVFSMYPDLANSYRELANGLLRTGATEEFPIWAREMIATFVSARNGCEFCTESHKAITLACNPPDSWKTWISNLRHVDQDLSTMLNPIQLSTDEMVQKWGLVIQLAEIMRATPRAVGKNIVADLQELGFDTRSVCDLCLIVSAFCMFNRMVEGLGTTLPPAGNEHYTAVGKHIAQYGYGAPKS